MQSFKQYIVEETANTEKQAVSCSAEIEKAIKKSGGSPKVYDDPEKRNTDWKGFLKVIYTVSFVGDWYTPPKRGADFDEDEPYDPKEMGKFETTVAAIAKKYPSLRVKVAIDNRNGIFVYVSEK